MPGKNHYAIQINADGTIAMDATAKLPIFINKDGAEAPFDADTTVANIGRLNGEAKAHREAAWKPPS
jgi:hypothetical protein